MNRNCELCGKWSACHRHHLIGGTANRKNAERYNLTMYLCPDCHRNAHEDPGIYKMLHQYGERKFMREQDATVEDFIRVFGKNYLWEEQE